MNILKTTILLALLTGLFLFIGQALGGQQGMIMAFILAAIMNLGAYWFSDKIVLRMYNATEVTSSDAPELYSIVKELAIKAGLPMPRLYMIQDETPNAFATGRNPQHAAVAVTSGILRILDREELKGVIAHELSHVYHRDTLISSIAATIAGAIAMLANMAQWAMIFGRSEHQEQGSSNNIFGGLLMMIVAPIAATLIQLAVSRSREYAADARGAKLSGQPLALASALQKLETINHQMPMEKAEARPATAHLFIVNPLSGRSMLRMFATHPPTEERIRRLKEMASRVTRI
jgi:heat shock protein HtpX